MKAEHRSLARAARPDECDLAIIVVSYRTGPALSALIESVDDAVDGATWFAAVVNNAPEEDLRGAVPVDDRIVVVEAGDNLGYSGGLNLGLAHIRPARHIAFLNPDLTLLPGSLAALMNALDAGSAAAVPLILDGTGRRQSSLRREPTLLAGLGEALFGDGWPRRPQRFAEVVRRSDAYGVAHDVDWATGAAVIVRADVVRQVGAWDAERFFLYSEETDYARRIRDLGGRIRFVPSAVVRHRGGGSGSSPQLDALLEVNKLRYFRKWHGPTASAFFAGVLLVRNALRPHRAGARAAVRALLSPSVRAALPGGAR